jgi:hypothetical protein
VLAVLALLVALLSGCREAAFGLGGAHSRSADEPTPDLAGTDPPADLRSAGQAARATVGVTAVVEAMAQVIGELGDAVGDLFPDEDHPCPDGGSASSDLGGSLNHPKLRMEFRACVRGAHTLDGIAVIRCDDYDSRGCHRGQATLGENGAVLYYRHDADGAARVVLLAGIAEIALDQDAGWLYARTWLQGEQRNPASGARYSFVTDAFAVDIRQTGEDVQEIRLEGVAGIGGGAEAAACITGRFDTETPAEPLLRSAGRMLSGTLRHHSPAPRPGEQQAQTVHLDEGLDAQGADGSRQIYTADELATYCTLE